MRESLEYATAWVGLKLLGLLPRPVARFVGAGFAAVAYAVRTPLRRSAMFNLRLAFPEWTDARRKRVIRGMVRQIGWMVGEFSQFPKYTRETIERIVVVDGFENFDAARRRGKGVLFLTGHMSAWELAPFAQALYGHPLHFLVRPIANKRVDALINGYRCRSGNQPIDKNRSARAILKVLGEGGTVGVLADHNTDIEESVFVDFFGVSGFDYVGPRPNCFADRRVGRARLSFLGRQAPEIPPAIRARRGTRANGERRSRTSSKIRRGSRA